MTLADVEIVRQIARHRFLPSTHVAALVGRSHDRTNDRLMRLFHAGYVDRPRAQLDYYPTAGSAPLVYALADRGARLLAAHDGNAPVNVEWSRKNREAGRPFIEHQIEVVNFQLALQRGVAQRTDLRLIPLEEMKPAASRQPRPTGPASFALHAKLSHRGMVRVSSVIPDYVFGLQLASGARRNFMVEIDRGTMPVRRSDPAQTSIEGKMRIYLAAHAVGQHQRQFGWKNFRVLFVTTDAPRIRTMREALRQIRIPRSVGAALFLFATLDKQRAPRPLACRWLDGSGSTVRLI